MGQLWPTNAEYCSDLRNSASTMVGHQTVCCMCGDVGFPDKLFRCTGCRHRFQHSYCSNYYSESSGKMELCDWCQSEERSAKHGGASSRRSGRQDGGVSTNRSEYAVVRIKQNDREEHTDRDKGKSTTSTVPSPRPTARRYKLLKDVMC
ncbi:hypothetical protein NE237_027827 [Protea cynaroides]|uniref:PHD-type zinc finger plants domain-containing protein n=1 Tax=Protea cynaroides TaxID=273540 RepID=A0A9Q0GR85_9MAGN|nr:hypothetical protein NE237_027827 [Protea cynaroides]